jgi:hypothetical protein
MGLDMYLTKKIYIGAEYKHNEIAGQINLTRNGEKININLSKVSYIEEHAAYWRKDNHIHKWFVDNVQDGEDDCGIYHVSREKLEALLKACKQVKENTRIGADVLPTQGGFFFGGTEYDESYMNGIDKTILQIEESLKYATIFDEFYYHSSW